MVRLKVGGRLRYTEGERERAGGVVFVTEKNLKLGPSVPRSSRSVLDLAVSFGTRKHLRSVASIIL